MLASTNSRSANYRYGIKVKEGQQSYNAFTLCIGGGEQ